MIRINLLGAPKPKKCKKASLAMPSFSGEGPNIFVVVLVVILLTVIGNGAWYWKLQRDATKIQEQLSVAEAENRRLADVKARYLEREKQKNDYKRRVDVIEQLRANQSGPVTLMAAVAETVNSADAVWLTTMSDDGKAVNIKGVALSVHSIADLMKALQRSGQFKSVEINEATQDVAVRDMQAFVFTLVCEKAPKT